MNGIDLTHAETPTPKPTDYWLGLGGDLQRRGCQGFLDGHGYALEVLATNRRAEVTSRLRHSMSAAERGLMLLAAEAMLKAEMDPAVTLWLQALEDRNALRKFRGVVIHDDRD